ncbi:hypothetical protein [Streptomyces lydicus]|uniref:hypothetical protein n=1 Tax=Streptomyces lydicus TaxID=47763 RepID=UPI003791DAB1
MDGALGAPEGVAETTTLPLLQPTPLAEHGVLAGLDEGVPAHRIVPARAPFVAEGAATGAPQAVQVADRWHFWHNLGEAAERSVAQHRGCLRVLVPEPAPRTAPEPTPPEDASGSPWPTGHRFADRIRARHATVHALLEAGHSRRSIGRQLHMTHRTVKCFADAAKLEDLFRGQWQNNRTSVLDEYKPYLDDR